MIKLEGTIINVLPNKVVKIKKLVMLFEDRDKVQLMGELELPNGDIKHELINLIFMSQRRYT